MVAIQGSNDSAQVLWHDGTVLNVQRLNVFLKLNARKKVDQVAQLMICVHVKQDYTHQLSVMNGAKLFYEVCRHKVNIS